VPYNQHVHHRRSIRLPSYDYAQRGAYFVTICTYEKECLFDDAHMRGVIERSWTIIVNPEARIDDGDLVVMPNHVHGVVWIHEDALVGARHHTAGLERTKYPLAVPGLSPQPRFGASPLHPGVRSPFALCTGSLGAIVGSFKSSAARRINNIRRTPGAPVWQRSYHDHIIRNEEDLRRVREYIRDNPRKWVEDPENPLNRRQS